MEEHENFIIDNDKKADWAIKTISEAEAERARLVKLAEEEIEELNEKIEKVNAHFETDTAYLKSLLFDYFGKVPHKKTKTQESYKLLSGSLVYKVPSVKIAHDDEKLLEYLDGTEYVKVKKSVDWAEFKKHLDITESNEVVNVDTGEIVEACSIEDVAASFNIKF